MIARISKLDKEHNIAFLEDKENSRFIKLSMDKLPCDVSKGSILEYELLQSVDGGYEVINVKIIGSTWDCYRRL